MQNDKMRKRSGVRLRVCMNERASESLSKNEKVLIA